MRWGGATGRRRGAPKSGRRDGPATAERPEQPWEQRWRPSWPSVRHVSTINHVRVRQISDYVEEFPALGHDEFRRRYHHPVLLLEDEGEGVPDAGFDTAVISPDSLDGLRQEAAESSIPPADALCSGSVVPVLKRPGSPFPDQIGVGRARNVDVWLPLRGISKYHGYFTRLEDGSYAVADAGSRNGIVVEARRIPLRTPVAVADRGKIAFGPHRFVFFGAEVFCQEVARRAARRDFDL